MKTSLLILLSGVLTYFVYRGVVAPNDLLMNKIGLASAVGALSSTVVFGLDLMLSAFSKVQHPTWGGI